MTLAKMFNLRTLNIIRISMKIFSSLGSNPYCWDSKRKCISVCSTLKRNVAFMLAVLVTGIQLCFLLYRLVQHSQELKSNFSFETMVWLLIWIIITIWPLVSFHNGWTKKKEVVSLFRGVRLLARYFEKGMQTKGKMWNSHFFNQRRIQWLLDITAWY